MSTHPTAPALDLEAVAARASPATLPSAPSLPAGVRSQDKVHLVLAYLGLLCVVPLLVEKDSEFVRWHARNGLVLTLAGFLLWGVTSYSVWLAFLSLVVLPLQLILPIVGIVKALRGERFELPLLSELASRF